MFFALCDTSKEFQVDQGELHTEQKTTGQKHDPLSSHLFHSTEPHPSKTLAYKQLFCLDEAQCFEDNSEAELMSKEEVESVLTVIPKEGSCGSVVICNKTTHLQIIEAAQNGSLAEVLTKDNGRAILIFLSTFSSLENSVQN